MKKFFKILGITIISIVVLLYLAFLFVLPKAVDLNKFKPDLQQIVKEQTNLTLDFDNPQITVTPLLSAGITADNVKIKLPDNSEVITSDNFKARIALPSLFLLTVKIPTVEILNPVINIDIVDGKAFKAVQAFEEILNKKEENIEQNLQTAQKPLIDPALIKVVIPGIRIINYSAKVNDLKTGNYLKLAGDELVFGYNNGKSISLKTNADLFLNEVKNITANIDIDTCIPQHSKLDEEDDKVQRVEIPFINPVAMYMAYDLKTNIDSKIKIRQKENYLVSRGYLNIDNFTLKLAGLQLPESKLHIKTRGTKADLDTDLYITEKEKLSLLGMIKYAKNPKMDLKITSNEIHTDNVINLIRATLDSLHIKHELQPIAGEGYFIADTKIKTDFKKLNSYGKITIKDLVIKNNAKKLQLARINSIISLDNSILKFIDTTVEIAQTLFKIDGTIDEKSIADINVFMEKMPLAKVFTMFLPSEINNTYDVNSGFINLTAHIKGELKKASADLNLTLSNLSLTDKVNKINYLNNILTADFISDFQKVTGNIKNSDFKLMMNGANVACDKFNLEIGDKIITIHPAKISINNSSNVDFSGTIENYIKNPVFNFDGKGNLITNDLKQLLGKDLAIFIKNKGALPIAFNFAGDKKKQTFKASLEANKDNYITPVDIKNVQNLNTILQAVIDFKGDRLKIKDTGFFIKTVTQDPEDPEKTITKLTDIVSVDGTITKLNTLNPNINLIKVKMPSDIEGIICAFPKSTLKAQGQMFVFGDLKAPRIRGEFNLWDISIPELLIKTEKIMSKFEGKDLDVDIKNLTANGSDYNVLINADLSPSKYFTIKNLNLISQLTDVDKLMKVSDLAMKYVPQSSGGNTSNNSASADIPVIIRNGNIDIKQIKTGNIKLTDTTGNISLLNNIFYVNKLVTSAFEGRIRGDVSMNLISSEIKAILNGTGLNVEKTLLDTANMKDTLTGKMDFSTDLSLKGATYEEQMKSLKGKVDFMMKDGQLGPFGKLENLIMAENIRENDFFKSTIGSVLNSLLSFDTSRYNALKGHLTFNNGITEINPITTEGNIMATYIFGNFDLLKNKIDIKLRGRLGSQVSDSLGPVAMLNPINLMKATPGMSLVMGKLFFLFTEVVTEPEINQIPSLGKEISDTNATKFQVVVRGDVAKPLTLIKSFKWLVLSTDMEKAQEYLKSLPQDTKIPEEFQNMMTMDKEQLKEQAKETVKKKAKQAVSDSLSEETKTSIKETKQAIEENKENINKLKSLFKNKDKAKEDAKALLKEKAQKAKEDAINELKKQAEQSLSDTVNEETAK